jgi:protein-tyrosine phosphatase
MTTIGMPEGTVNFRDVGGMPLRGGGHTRHGVLYRSDALGTLTPAGLAALAASPIGIVVDFRTATERAMWPDVLPGARPIRTVELPLTEGALGGEAQQAALSDDPTAAAAAIEAALAAVPTLGEMYVAMLEHGAFVFAEVARLVAAPALADAPETAGDSTAVLIHCTAGKDRTGVASALLLDAVGVERDSIVVDYTTTERNLAGAWSDRMLATVSQLGVPLTDAITTIVTRSPREAITQALEWLDAQGGAAAYLTRAGVTDAELAALRTRLTA